MAIKPQPVRLNNAAFKALRREARRDLTNNVQERQLFKVHRDPDNVAEFQQRLLATADVLGALHRLDFVDGLAEVEFSVEALTWMQETKTETVEHLANLDQAESEASYSYNCKEAFLVHVLDRILDQQDGS